MEQHTIYIHQTDRHLHTGELQAHGTVERFGASLWWRAWLPACGPRWEIDFPPGQFVGDEGLDTEQLVFESDPPLRVLIRAELKRAVQHGAQAVSVPRISPV